MKQGQIDTIIGRGTQLRGTFHFTGAVRIDGFLVGRVEHVEVLVIGPEGRLEANVFCQEMEIAGEMHGDATVVGQLKILSSGRLFGDIRCGQLVVEEGAVFEGRSYIGSLGERAAEMQ